VAVRVIVSGLTGMFRVLTGMRRRRAGCWLALIYCLCVVVPPLVTGLAHAAAAHDGGVHQLHAMMHISPAGTANGMVHRHAMHGGQERPAPAPAIPDHKSYPVNCCGMFLVAGATVEFSVPVGFAPRGATLLPALQAAVRGLGPHRIDRPPIVLASV